MKKGEREREKEGEGEFAREKSAGEREMVGGGEILSPLFFFFSILLFSINVNSLDIYILDKSMS